MTHDRAGTAQRPLVVLGIGNILLGDDGVGVRVAQELAGDTGLPPATEVVDGGTRGLELLPLVAAARAVVIVDAIDVGAPPGSLHIYADDLLGNAVGTHLTVHQVGVADLIGAARLAGMLPAATVLVGIQVAGTEVGMELSRPVERALPGAVRTVKAWCAKFDRQHAEGGGSPWVA
ncbi:MAG TPA: hydrogenase maturation protease [Streptosporangiaceae bacterium]|nr:hydrogenase maturation protease [Streptosporangiaceae bacterium]